MLEIGLGSQRNRSSLTVKRLEKTKFTLDQEGVLGRANTHTEIAVGSYSKSGGDNVFPHKAGSRSHGLTQWAGLKGI